VEVVVKKLKLFRGHALEMKFLLIAFSRNTLALEKVNDSKTCGTFLAKPLLFSRKIIML